MAETENKHRILDTKMLQYEAIQNEEESNKKRYQELMERIAPFKNAQNFYEAKEILKKTFPVSNEINFMRIGNARCVIYNGQRCLKISVDTANEFICYHFVAEENK